MSVRRLGTLRGHTAFDIEAAQVRQQNQAAAFTAEDYEVAAAKGEIDRQSCPQTHPWRNCPGPEVFDGRRWSVRTIDAIDVTLHGFHYTRLRRVQRKWLCDECSAIVLEGLRATIRDALPEAHIEEPMPARIADSLAPALKDKADKGRAETDYRVAVQIAGEMPGVVDWLEASELCYRLQQAILSRPDESTWLKWADWIAGGLSTSHDADETTRFGEWAWSFLARTFGDKIEAGQIV